LCRWLDARRTGELQRLTHRLRARGDDSDEDEDSDPGWSSCHRRQRYAGRTRRDEQFLVNNNALSFYSARNAAAALTRVARIAGKQLALATAAHNKTADSA